MENKNYEQEEEDSGKVWEDLDPDRLPPCVTERAGFMRSQAYSLVRQHPYAIRNFASHQHFAPTVQRMPAHSLEVIPFRWMRREEVTSLERTWGFETDASKERRADEIMDFEASWVQDHRNQISILDSFFSAVTPGHSLVLLYAKDIPLIEDKMPGGRILVGAGRVRAVAPAQEWSYDRDPGDLLRSFLWERNVEHSIRPGFEDGFLLPYQQLLNAKRLQGRDLSDFVAWAPSDHFDEFSYVSELASDDAAIASLTELARVVDLLPGIADGPWEKVANWIGDRIAETWRSRGPYPGLGSAMTAAGLERGALIAHRVVEAMPPGGNLWKELEEAIHQGKSERGPAAGLVGRMAAKTWHHIIRDDDRYQLFRLLSSFSLSVDQARRFFDPELREEGEDDGSLVENPYRLFEIDRLRSDSVALSTIDRGLFPQDAAAKEMLDLELLPDAVKESADDRRVRAAAIQVLEDAAKGGHSLLDEAGLRRRVSDLNLEPPCDPPGNVWAIAAKYFGPLVRETPLSDGESRGWQLDRLAAAGNLIMEVFETRQSAGPVDVTLNWRDAIDQAIGHSVEPGDDVDEEARLEKSSALETLARSRFSVLVGPAGTGKTTMLRALCAQPDIATQGILLLAPTGKARVQLARLSGATALTLAQFLQPDRWDPERGYFTNATAERSRAYRTVIVDEASMLTEEMLAALLDSVSDVTRLILCGDHRQLPPIGPGRPFSDLVRHLQVEEISKESGAGFAVLSTGMRQRSDGNARASHRDDLAIADWISTESPSGVGDEALSRVLQGNGDGTIQIETWESEADLHESLVSCMEDELKMRRGESQALLRSLGAKNDSKGKPRFEWGKGGVGAERWQILSPIRSRAGGIIGLNSLVRLTWRRGHVQEARTNYRLTNPIGADEIVDGDKVMCVKNHRRHAMVVSAWKERPNEYVANGEMGIAVGCSTNKNGGANGLRVEFATQPELQYTFKPTGERDDEQLEVGYAITVHKAQGSQFELTFVVIPNPCALLSAEMLYTAMTRHRGRTIFFVQGGRENIRDLGGPMHSETARRLTRLFHAADPFSVPDGSVMDGFHVHRTALGEMVISKSEVIVANTLHEFGIEYAYELPLEMPDGTWRKPDFTIFRSNGPPIYWEHLGMLNKAGYRADWEAKVGWYAKHSILPLEEGGGDSGSLVWSEEGVSSRGIDSNEIRGLATTIRDLV